MFASGDSQNGYLRKTITAIYTIQLWRSHNNFNSDAHIPDAVLHFGLIQQELFFKTISCGISNDKIEDRIRMPMIVDSSNILYTIYNQWCCQNFIKEREWSRYSSDNRQELMDEQSNEYINQSIKIKNNLS